METLFERYGAPGALRDNGTPFAGSGPGGLSRVGGLGEGGDPVGADRAGEAVPNGSHERMHGTLKKETTRPAAATVAEQQERFTGIGRISTSGVRTRRWVRRCRRRSTRRSERGYPKPLPQPWYDAEHAVRRPSSMWGGRYVFVSMALAREPVGIAETPGGPWVVRADLELGLERGSRKLLPLDRKRRGPGQTNEERGR